VAWHNKNQPESRDEEFAMNDLLNVFKISPASQDYPAGHQILDISNVLNFILVFVASISQFLPQRF